jgi:hypothetical protein
MKLSLHGRLLAGVAGCMFATGGLTILLGSDLTSPRDWQASQWLTILTVFGTIAAGHLMVDAWRARHLFATVGFLVLFFSGTGLVVYSSVGRQVETAGVTTLSVEDANARLADLKAERQKAVARRDYANDQAAYEIAGRPDKHGRRTAKPYCGKSCKDWQQNARDVTASIEKLDREIAKIGPAKPVNAQAGAFADMAALFGASNKARTIAVLMLLVPFAKCLFFEIGSIVSLGFAFRQGKRPVVISVANDSSQTDFSISKSEGEKLRVMISGELPEPTPPKPGNRKKHRFPASNVVDFQKHPVVTALEKNGGSVSSNQQLAALMGVCEAESTKRVQEIESKLQITRNGKAKCIALRA